MPRRSSGSSGKRNVAAKRNPRRAQQSPSLAAKKYLPPDLDRGEAELLLTWGEFIQTRYANPERIGCPDDEILQKMARDAKNFHDHEIIDHAARCAPCSNTLQELIYAARQDRNARGKPR